MCSEMYLSTKKQSKHEWSNTNKCGCSLNTSHFAIITKGNIIEGIAAER